MLTERHGALQPGATTACRINSLTFRYGGSDRQRRPMMHSAGRAMFGAAGSDWRTGEARLRRRSGRQEGLNRAGHRTSKARLAG